MLVERRLRVVIPEDHRIVVDVPEDVPAGPAELILMVEQPASESAKARFENLADEMAGDPRPFGDLSPERPEDAVDIGAEIDGLYFQIRELVARSAAEQGLRQEIDLLVQRLRALQEREAVDLECLLKPQRRLEAGAGWEALARVDRLLVE